jgi:hypothetical protein
MRQRFIGCGVSLSTFYRVLLLHLIAPEHEFGQLKIAVRIIDFATGELTPESILGVVIIAVGRSIACRDFRIAVRLLHELLIHHHQTRLVPALARTAHVAPEVRAVDVKAAAHIVVARCLGCDGEPPVFKLHRISASHAAGLAGAEKH